MKLKFALAKVVSIPARTFPGPAKKLASKLDFAASRIRDNAAGSESKFDKLWDPIDQADALRLVLNVTDLEEFDQSGKLEAVEMSKFLKKGDVVLDLGCGVGRVSKYVAPLVSKVIAMDVSNNMLKYARQWLQGIDNIEIIQGKGDSLPMLADNSVDFAYSILTLQHMDRDDAFRLLWDLNRVLKSGSKAMFTFPNILSDTYLYNFTRHALDHDFSGARARYYTADEVHRILPAAGYEIDAESIDDEIRIWCHTVERHEPVAP